MLVTAGERLMFSASLFPFRSCIKGSHGKTAITSQYLEAKHAGKHNSLSELVIIERTQEEGMITSILSSDNSFGYIKRISSLEILFSTEAVRKYFYLLPK